jgi:Protein of unknown function (DUF1592)/Protein of unknown function (DUF1588)/Protein of unknown function (DUF1585)/Protein of unknown function (DUF1587)/Protein of unknown function (DUF1595)
MTRHFLSVLAVASIAATSGAGASWAAPRAPAAAGSSQSAATAKALSPGAATAAQAKPYWQMLGNYCEKCHNATDWAGDVAFDTMHPTGIPANAKIWEAAMVKLNGHLMPPPGHKQPPQAAVTAFISWMEGHLDEAGRAHPDPGYVVLHRLNRLEYARSVEDMLGVTVDPGTLLPKETESDDFDDIADVLKVSPTFLDQYVSAARTVAALAVGNPHSEKVVAIYEARESRQALSRTDSTRQNQAFHIEGLPLGTRGGMVVTHDFPADGDYEFDIDVYTGIGYYIGLDHPNDVVLTIDDQKVFERSIGGAKDLKAADQHSNAAAADFANRFRHIWVHVPAGPHRVGVAFIEKDFAESVDWLQPFNPRGGNDRIATIRALQIAGPFDPTGVSETPSREKIFICHPANTSEELPCARKILGKLAGEAYRRPVTDADLAAPMRFFAQGRVGKSFDAGIENGIVAILCSPKFLFRTESELPEVKVGGIYRLSDLDLASRLSFFLWSEGPDQELLDLAAAGTLHNPSVLQREVRRMLADPRAESLVTSFAFQWLKVDSMDKIVPDAVEYAEFDEDLRTAYRTEMRLFLDSVLLKDRDVRELMTANWTYVNERLALEYGIPNVRGAQFRRVQLTDSHRFGLLGKGAILMGTSYANRTAPVLRGAWILDVVTDTPPHAPPPSIPALIENVPGGKQLTIRQRMEIHRRQPSCNACHGIMDPMGLALENFDAMGGWQTKDRDAGLPIDAAGRMANGTVLRGPDDLRRALMGNPQLFVQTITEKLMTFALGRTLDYHDMPTVRAIVRNAAQDDDRFSAIVLGIIASPQFQMQHAPGTGHAGPANLRTTQAANLN